MLYIIILLGRGALYRAKVAYRHRTFPPTICWSECLLISALWQNG